MSELAYLVIREGTKWSDVFRLVPGQSITIGRAPTNQIVIKDERCSRTHVELFMSGGKWILRDLDSRNGTLVGDTRVTADWPLTPGDMIRIGRSQLVFVHRLSEAFADSSTIITRPAGAKPGGWRSSDDDSSVLSACEPTTITHRRGQTKFLEAGEEDTTGTSKIGAAAAKLCRLAFELAKAPDMAALGDLALSGLVENTQTDTAALLLLP
ncbi:MAG: FHA domain-containing protein, partial [Patescibacteria group bacterium]|nr:FHA domain-containing protein [Patescibacteria group bacterium]